MTCPDCDLHRIRAAMWRNKAYELNGTPLPWNAEELIQKAVLKEREACCAIVFGQCGSDNVAQRTVDAIRARDNNCS